MERVVEWIGYANPDVLCLQETKLTDEAFPTMAFSELGYASAHRGQGQWNGVAILSRVGLEEVRTSFDGLLGKDARLIAASCGGVRVHSVYVPNGRALGTEYYEEKLRWLEELHHYFADSFSPSEDLMVAGDFNIAPEDRDVWDPAAFQGLTHVSPPERERLAQLLDWGLQDAFRLCYEDSGLFSWWDYRSGAFHLGHGMRIDLVLISSPLAEKLTWSFIDRNARKGSKPSDHAPVVVDLALPTSTERASL
jgi:exodeoxyribonuclease-3